MTSPQNSILFPDERYIYFSPKPRVYYIHTTRKKYRSDPNQFRSERVDGIDTK